MKKTYCVQDKMAGSWKCFKEQIVFDTLADSAFEWGVGEWGR